MMRMPARWTLIGLLAAAVAQSACLGDDDYQAPTEPPLPSELFGALEAIPGMTVSEEAIDPPYRFFRLLYEQPVDHADPDGARFQQRITLLHVDPLAPTVLHTSGYYLYDYPFASELTFMTGGNQVHIEQRFFEPSRPSPADWSKLTIEQAAGDHHRIVQALRPFYPGPWVSTGGSKGGMTSIFHRRFWPDDVDATVAYVAPISFGTNDPRYVDFFDTVGDAACRQALRDFQRELLTRREPMIDRMAAYATAEGLTFTRLAGVAGAFEDSVAEFTWGMWQYGDASWCQDIPPVSATDDQLWSVHAAYGDLEYFSDVTVDEYEPYYYQSDTELGYPALPLAHLEDLLETQDIKRDVLPAGVSVTHDPTVMEDIDAWVHSEGERLLFIYGERDPWTAGAFELGEADDSFLFVAPGLNHGAKIEDLTAADQAIALAALERWLGVPLTTARPAAASLPPEPPPHLRPPHRPR